ncbi:MAG: UbiA prenyltransferase family protein [Erysipelotrichaceae bacterium]
MKNYLKLMRVHHYIKNILVFLPLIFSGRLVNGKDFSLTLLGFIAFCLMSSVIYIINDIKDVEKDRKHSTKKNRPIAAGIITIKQAGILGFFLFFISVIMLYFTGCSEISPWLFMILYFILNILYSFGLKNFPIMDIAILVSGFLIRVLFGAAITNIEVSNWLYLTIMSVSFYLALGKRRNEAKNETGSRIVLNYYSYDYLDKNMYIALACSFVFYALWCVDPTTILRFKSNFVVWTVPLVILIGMKYSLNIEGESDGDPVEVILQDKVLITLIVFYSVIMAFLLYR